MVNKIKENWNKQDKKCEVCGNVIEKTTGLNKHNLKRLFFSTPRAQDIIIFIMIIGCLLLAWSYNVEITQYKKMVSNPEGFCLKYYNDIISVSDVNTDYIDVSGLVSTND